MSMNSDEAYATIEAVLRSSGVRIDDPNALLWAASVGAYHRMIRNADNGIWENLHSEKTGLTDGEMMRANAQGVRLIHDSLTAGGDWEAAANKVTSPGRILPDGRRLADYLGARLRAMRSDALRAGEVYDDVAFSRGHQDACLHATVALLGLGAHLGYGAHWHGMPGWPAIVETFCVAVDDASHPHWRGRYPVMPRPVDIADTAELHRTLLDGPDRLSAEAAEWCVDHAAIGYVVIDNPRS